MISGPFVLGLPLSFVQSDDGIQFLLTAVFRIPSPFNKILGCFLNEIYFIHSTLVWLQALLIFEAHAIHCHNWIRVISDPRKDIYKLYNNIRGKISTCRKWMIRPYENYHVRFHLAYRLHETLSIYIATFEHPVLKFLPFVVLMFILIGIYCGYVSISAMRAIMIFPKVIFAICVGLWLGIYVVIFAGSPIADAVNSTAEDKFLKEWEPLANDCINQRRLRGIRAVRLSVGACGLHWRKRFTFTLLEVALGNTITACLSLQHTFNMYIAGFPRY